MALTAIVWQASSAMSIANLEVIPQTLRKKNQYCASPSTVHSESGSLLLKFDLSVLKLENFFSSSPTSQSNPTKKEE